VKKFVPVALFVFGLLGGWEGGSRWRIPQPDDFRLTILDGPPASVGTHVDGSIRFVVKNREVLRFDPDGVICVESRIAGTDPEIMRACRRFFEGSFVTYPDGLSEEIGSASDTQNITFQSVRAGVSGSGGDIVVENTRGIDYTKGLTTEFDLSWESPEPIVKAALRHAPPADGYEFDHVTRDVRGHCVIFWKKTK
jgi:hypothetical protein